MLFLLDLKRNLEEKVLSSIKIFPVQLAEQPLIFTVYLMQPIFEISVLLKSSFHFPKKNYFSSMIALEK